VPVASVNVDGSPALNRVKWAQSGMTVTVSDDNGKIWVYELGEVSQKTNKQKNPQLRTATVAPSFRKRHPASLLMTKSCNASVLFFVLFFSCVCVWTQQLAVPRADEWTRLLHTLQDLRQNQLDEDMDKLNFGGGVMSVGGLSSLGGGGGGGGSGSVVGGGGGGGGGGSSSLSQLAGTTSPPSSLSSLSSVSSVPMR